MTDSRERIRRVLKWAALGTWSPLVLVIVFFNLRLYCSPPLPENKELVPPALFAQLAANRAAIDEGAAAHMQEFFPEGFYFTYLFHGLTWIELSIRDKSYASKAIDEALWCLSYLESPEGRQPFPRQLPPDHGMFYSAWKCSLRAGVVLLQHGNDEVQLGELRRECDAIASALKESETPYLPSYFGQAWPCDSVPAIHALAVYDHITGEDRYDKVVGMWLEATRDRLDPETGLIPHTSAGRQGREIGNARATSQMIMLRLLPDIDADFAKDQYERFRQRFLTTFTGAPCVLEYPSGITGPGDVDSGPLIYGRSLSATVLMMGVAQIYGDQNLAGAIAQAGETIGLPWTWNGRKRYAFGALPIGDVMVAYAHVARPWLSGSDHLPDQRHPVPQLWRIWIHLFSSLLLLPMLVVILARWRAIRGNPSDSPDPNHSDGLEEAP